MAPFVYAKLHYFVRILFQHPKNLRDSRLTTKSPLQLFKRVLYGEDRRLELE